MMLGELDYNDLYYNQNDFFNASIFNSTNINSNSTVEIEQATESQVYPVTAHIILLGFVIFVSIILMNLLVGLAVSDIQTLKGFGKCFTLIQQVMQVFNTLIEFILLGSQ